MKYCSKCGASLNDDAVICVNCGCVVDKIPDVKNERVKKEYVSEYSPLASVVPLLSSIVSAFLLLFYLVVFCSLTVVSSGTGAAYLFIQVASAFILPVICAMFSIICGCFLNKQYSSASKAGTILGVIDLCAVVSFIIIICLCYQL